MAPVLLPAQSAVGREMALRCWLELLRATETWAGARPDAAAKVRGLGSMRRLEEATTQRARQLAATLLTAGCSGSSETAVLLAAAGW